MTKSAFGIDHGQVSKGMFNTGFKLASKNTKAANLGGALRGGKKFKAGEANARELGRLQRYNQSLGPRPKSPF